MRGNNTPILLRDVAEVKMAPALRSGNALIMGKPGVLLSLASQYGANTLDASLAVETALAELEPALKKQGIDDVQGPASSGEFHRTCPAESQALVTDSSGPDPGCTLRVPA